MRQRQLRATLFLAQNSDTMTKFSSYSGIEAAAHTLSLAGYGGSSCVIELRGYYTDWQSGEVDGTMIARAVLTGVSDNGGMISMN